MKFRILTEPFISPHNSNFIADASRKKRAFRYICLSQNTPRLAYSLLLKGPLCLTWVLLRQSVHRGLQGSFITSACTKFHAFNECARNYLQASWRARNYLQASWHVGSTEDAANLRCTRHDPGTAFKAQMDAAVTKIIADNRKKLQPILSTVTSSAAHDIPLHGKDSFGGNFCDLLDLCIEAGDTILKKHSETAAGSARYTSHRVQNELFAECEPVIRNEIVCAANSAVGLSVLADETADNFGVEQLSLGVRFVDGDCIREEFFWIYSSF